MVMGDLFDTLMGAAEDTMDKIEAATAPVEPEGVMEYTWRAVAATDKVWVFHAFRGNRPICNKEVSLIGDQSLKGGYVNACCTCMRMTCAIVEDEE